MCIALASTSGDPSSRRGQTGFQCTRVRLHRDVRDALVSEPSPEAVFRWAPAVSGTTIETCGSAYDTVLYVRRGACTPGGECEICADDNLHDRAADHVYQPPSDHDLHHRHVEHQHDLKHDPLHPGVQRVTDQRLGPPNASGQVSALRGATLRLETTSSRPCDSTTLTRTNSPRRRACR
jgi:hypothetical protein